MFLKKFIFVFSLLTIVGCESEKFTASDGRVLEVSSLIGMNVFDIAYEFSEVGPETLTGTNNERWIVFYEDMNVTLVTNKSTDIVQKAKKGKNPKSSVWAD